MNLFRYFISKTSFQLDGQPPNLKKSGLRLLAAIFALVFVSLCSTTSKASNTTLSSTSGAGIRYSIQASNIRNITSPSTGCEDELGITIGSPKGFRGSVEVGLYSNVGLLFSSKSGSFESDSFSNLVVSFSGCADPSWKSHTWDIVVYSDYSQTIQTLCCGPQTSFGSETIELGSIQSPPNRSKPKVIQVSVLPNSRTANVVLGSNQKANDPKFRVYYQITPKSSKPSGSKWKQAPGPVFTLTSLKGKTSYDLHTKLQSIDGVFGEAKRTSFRTK